MRPTRKKQSKPGLDLMDKNVAAPAVLDGRLDVPKLQVFSGQLVQ